MEGYYYYSIASGSKGNAGLFITPDANILIDMGISYKYLCESLKKHEIEKIDIALITHEHSDHTKGLQMLAKKTNIPIYITKKSYNALKTEIIDTNINFFEPNEQFYIDDLDILSFRTPHDSVESVGFNIRHKEMIFSYVTDLGFMPNSVLETIKTSDFLVLESNYDKLMLETGPYPYTLKQRILSSEGHLSNYESAKCVANLLESGVSQIVLAHLSENNNTHKCVRDEIENTLKFYKITAKIGEDIHIAPIKNDYPLIKITKEIKCLV